MIVVVGKKEFDINRFGFVNFFEKSRVTVLRTLRNIMKNYSYLDRVYILYTVYCKNGT